jgi:hypothetical protein
MHCIRCGRQEKPLLAEALPDVKCDCARLDGRKCFAATFGDNDVSCFHGFGGNRLTIDVAPRESMLLGMQMKLTPRRFVISSAGSTCGFRQTLETSRISSSSRGFGMLLLPHGA